MPKKINIAPAHIPPAHVTVVIIIFSITLPDEVTKTNDGNINENTEILTQLQDLEFSRVNIFSNAVGNTIANTQTPEPKKAINNLDGFNQCLEATPAPSIE